MQQQMVEVIGYFIFLPVFKSIAKLQSNTVGFACILLLIAASPVEYAFACDMSIEEHGLLFANCTYRSLQEVPQNLSTSTLMLDLSNNPLRTLNEKSFTRYSELHVLVLKNITLDLSKVELYSFRPLKDLRVINLSGSHFSSRAYFYFPASIRIININELRLKDIDVSQLRFLETLLARNNELSEFPIIHELTNLTTVDLDGNPLESLSPERLAPFCKLHTLNLHINLDSRFIVSFARYCLCKRTNLWTINYNIEGNKLPCVVPPYGDQCDETFSDDTLAVYNECVERYSKGQNYLAIALLATIIILIVGGSGVGYCCYVFKISPSSGRSHQRKNSALAEPVESLGESDSTWFSKHGSSKHGSAAELTETDDENHEE